MRRAIAAALPVAMLCGVARAQSATGSSALPSSYLYDGNAVAWFWLPALGALAIDRWAEPRSTPLYFDARDGGAPRASWEVPAWGLHVAAAGLGVAMAVGDDDSRWYHVKGLAEAIATSALVVSALKPLVGRHRPDLGARQRGWHPQHVVSIGPHHERLRDRDLRGAVPARPGVRRR